MAKRSRTTKQRHWKYVGLGCLTIIFMVLFSIVTQTEALLQPLAVQAATPAAQVLRPITQLAPQSASEQVQAGMERYQAGQFAAAITLWQQALEQFVQQDDRLNQAAVQSNLALAYQQLGQIAEANQAIAASLTLLQPVQTSDAQKLRAQAFNIQGSVYLAQGKAEQALDSWQEATAAYKQLGDAAGTYRTLINQTQAMRAMGLYIRAKNTLEEVNETLQKQPDATLKAAGLLNLGEVLRLMGDLPRAQEVLQQSLAIGQQSASNGDRAATLLSLGNTLRALQQPTEALTAYSQAETTAATPLAKAQAKLNQLSLLMDTKQLPAARAIAAEIQPLLMDLPPNRSTILAQIHFAQNLARLQPNYPTSTQSAQFLAKAAQQAKALSDPRAESYALGYLAGLYEQTRQWTEAQRLTERSLALAQTSNAPDIAYRWQWQLGRLLAAQGDRTQAIAAYSEAVNTLSSIRNDLVSNALDVQFSFRESVEPVYRQLVGLLLQPNGQETSQENLRKAREVIESLQVAELDNFFQEACLQGRSVQIDQIDPQAAVVYPIILSDRLEVVLSIPNQPLRHFAAPVRQPQLERSVSQMRQSLRRVSSSRERLTSAQQMYDLLIRPLEKDLQVNDIKTLAFVLDGSLKNLPMAALHDGQKYLVEKYNLAITPGLQLLSPRSLQPQQLRVLIGGLSEERGGFVSLPGVEAEVKQIGTKVPSQVLFNQSFTANALQKQVQATPYPVLHLATHGQFSSNANDTFILTWDRVLNVKELGSLLQTRDETTREPIELLVMSACQTAAGDQRAALGLAGVAVRSGARSTLATLWSVDDASTSLFMQLFYQELVKPGVRKSEALRLAQLELMKQPELNHPYFWAPFVMVGNWL
ncbi:MAG: CHAT domain-containing protein [Leptolyngbyaceae cyanobacterium bins.302]|nr:CHAT domain-containing protein [Leptolyngbyaceae cyanobacterium bins.302]